MFSESLARYCDRYAEPIATAFHQQQAKLLDDIFKKAAPHITAIAKRDGYTIIFEKTQSALLWSDPAVDLTPEVNKKL